MGKRRPGFSLIEIVVTVSIVAVAITLVAPSTTRMIQRQEAKNLLKSVDRNLSDLRVLSFRESRPLSAADISIRLQEQLPAPWVIEISPETNFSSAGYCSGGILTMSGVRAESYVYELTTGECHIGDRLT